MRCQIRYNPKSIQGALVQTASYTFLTRMAISMCSTSSTMTMISGSTATTVILTTSGMTTTAGCLLFAAYFISLPTSRLESFVFVAVHSSRRAFYQSRLSLLIALYISCYQWILSPKASLKISLVCPLFLLLNGHRAVFLLAQENWRSQALL